MPLSPLTCILQEEDYDAEAPRIVAEEVVRGRQDCLEMTSYRLRDRDEPGDPEDPEISDVMLLPRAAWETLVRMYALRYPEAAARIVARAQGWGEKKHADLS